MLATIRAKLGIVFASFMLLVAGSVIATALAISTQATDALVINLAGRQRMLTQKMTKAVLGIARDPLRATPNPHMPVGRDDKPGGSRSAKESIGPCLCPRSDLAQDRRTPPTGLEPDPTSSIAFPLLRQPRPYSPTVMVSLATGLSQWWTLSSRSLRPASASASPSTPRCT